MCIEWNKQYELEIDLIDGQHRLLADIINDIGKEAIKGIKTPFLRILVAELRRNAERHFATEEWFLNAGMLLRPTPEARACDLDKLLYCVTRIEHHLDTKPGTVPPDIVAGLGEWWEEHMVYAARSLAVATDCGCSA